jgi:uncharacterized protein with HEPN domain
MLNHAVEAVELTHGRDRAALDTDRVLQLALVRLVEIVGEAATRVTPAAQQSHPQIPWPQARGMRNRLVHGYDAVDLDVLWATIQDDFPVLIAQLRQALRGPS